MKKEPLWIDKKTYQTRLIADDKVLECPGSEVQMVQFFKGKFSHVHKRKTEFFYFISGQGKAIVNQEIIELEAGRELLIQPNIPHEFINNSDTPLEAVMFKTNSKSDDTFPA